MSVEEFGQLFAATWTMLGFGLFIIAYSQRDARLMMTSALVFASGFVGLMVAA